MLATRDVHSSARAHRVASVLSRRTVPVTVLAITVVPTAAAVAVPAVPRVVIVGATVVVPVLMPAPNLDAAAGSRLLAEL